MDFDFAVTLSEVRRRKLITMEIGVGPNGDPIYRVALFNGKKWSSACYYDLRDAYTTYKFLKRVI